MSNIEKHEYEPEHDAEFDLKSRLTGAAVLLLLGALVLPWLLGPPSEASKVPSNQQSLDLAVATPDLIEVQPADLSGSTELATPVNTQVNDIEETVYISKITPLDAKRNKNLAEAARQAAIENSDRDATIALEKLVREAETKVDSVAPQTVITNNDSQDMIDNQQQKLSPQELAQQNREAELQAALAAELKSQQGPVVPTATTETVKRVDVGWVVQVGVFLEKSRSLALIDELKDSGFVASSSVVDTNQGKNTGNRVWLGPFTKRALAIDEKERLMSKAGKDGFVRLYP